MSLLKMTVIPVVSLLITGIASASDSGKLGEIAVKPVSSTDKLNGIEWKGKGEYERQQYQATADGTRFLVNAKIGDAAPRVLIVGLNWNAALNK